MCSFERNKNLGDNFCFSEVEVESTCGTPVTLHAPGRHFKNTYEILNPSDLKNSDILCGISKVPFEIPHKNISPIHIFI